MRKERKKIKKRIASFTIREDILEKMERMEINKSQLVEAAIKAFLEGGRGSGNSTTVSI